MKPTEIMKACGSKTGAFEPESIDHWRWMLANGEGPERALAWIRLHSIANGSPFCVNQAGRALTIQEMADDLKLASKTAENVCYQLVKEGRIRTQRGRVFYRADVPNMEPQESVDREENDFVQSHFPTYLHESIRNLSPEKRAKLKSYCDWHDGFFAEVMSFARSIDEQVQDTTLADVGLEKKRLTKEPRPAAQFAQLSLVAAPDFVQSHLDLDAPLFVQTPKNGLHKVENGSVRSGASLLSSDSDSDKNSGPPAASTQVEKAAAAAAIAQVMVRCGELNLQIPDQELSQKLLLRFPSLPPSNWPRFQDQRSPALWLRKTQDEMVMEATRQERHTRKPAARAPDPERERRDALAVLDQDPLSYPASQRDAVQKIQADARATLARLDAECGAQPKTKGQTA